MAKYNQTLNDPNNRWIIGNASVDTDVSLTPLKDLGESLAILVYLIQRERVDFRY